MTTKELFQACLEAWKVKEDRKYRLDLDSRRWSEHEISLESEL